MDTNPPEGQQNQQTPQNQDPVVFSSTAIASTKSRSSAQYFTKVQKATPWQKFSEWFARKRNASQAALDAKQAEFKANRAAKKRAAELAAYNIPMPNGLNNQPAQPQTQPTAPAQPIAAQSASIQPTPADPSQPAAINTFTEVELPVDTTPTDFPTKSKKPIIIILIIAAICIIAAVVLFILHPWSQDAALTPEQIKDQEASAMAAANNAAGATETGLILDPETQEVVDINMETATAGAGLTYVQSILNSAGDVNENALDSGGLIDTYIVAENIDSIVKEKGITDPDKLLLFELEKARRHMYSGRSDAALKILGQIEEDNLYVCQAEMYYGIYYTYYHDLMNDKAQAEAYASKIRDLPAAPQGVE